MKIGLFGFTFGHENMGCQALTCAFLELVVKNLPDEDVEVINFCAEEYLGNIPELFPMINFQKYQLSFKKKPFEGLAMIRKCDVIFDETYGDGFSDIYFGDKIKRNILIKCLLGVVSRCYVMTPQTYGPFKNKKMERLAGKAIAWADYVYARDMISARYGEKISGRKIVTMSDMAFALPYIKNFDNNQVKKMGLNISGLLWQGGFEGNKNQFGLSVDYQEYCRRIIEYALEKGMEVHIIPHVTSAADKNRTIPDGDYPVCESIASEYKAVKLAPCFTTAYEAKNYIAAMDFFVGARMHATIGAFSSGVVTIPFAYSRKFQGLYDNLGYPYIVDGTKGSTLEAVEKTIEMINQEGRLVESQKIAMSCVNDNLKKFQEELKYIFHKVQ